MSAVKILRHLRLFPAVIIVGSGLLVLKGVGLVHDAQAQTAITGQVAAAPAGDTTQVAVADPSIDDSDSTSAAEVAVLTSLSKRRTALDAREQSLGMQANLIDAAEKRVDTKIASLKDLQSQIQALLGKRDAAEQVQLNALVKTYSSMKPADAARIFNSLDDTVALNVAALMKADVLGAILSKMQPNMAENLTVRLANRLKLPDPAAALAAVTEPASTQTASLDPAAATPTPVAPAPDSAPAPDAPPTPPAAEAKAQTAAPAPAAPTTKAASVAPKTQASTAPATPAPAKAEASAPPAAKANTPAAPAKTQASKAAPISAADAKPVATKPKGV